MKLFDRMDLPGRGATIVLCALFWTLGSAAAEETVPDPGRRYRVTGVAAGDVLNLRAGPSAETEKVGELVSDAAGVIVSGARVADEGADWWRVVLPQGGVEGGWVNARYLALDPSRETVERDFFLRCAGTEPFWSLDLTDGRATYSPAEGAAAFWQASDWLEASNRSDRYAVGLKDGADVGYAVVAREQGFCSDGMSEIGYPFDLTLITPDGKVLSGCCERAAD